MLLLLSLCSCKMVWLRMLHVTQQGIMAFGTPLVQVCWKHSSETCFKRNGEKEEVGGAHCWLFG